MLHRSLSLEKAFYCFPFPQAVFVWFTYNKRGSLEMSSHLCSLLADKLLNLNPPLGCEHQLISVSQHSFGRGALQWAMSEQSKRGKPVP